MRRNKKEPVIIELIRQAKLLLCIWAFSFFVYTLIFFIPIEKFSTLVNKSNFMAVSEDFGFIYGIGLYLILSFLYLTFYYLIDRSVSATILEIIDKAPAGRLSLDEVKKIYNIDKKYQSELSGMLEGGFIVKEQDYYKNSSKGSLYAKIAHFIKSLLKLE